MTTEEISCYELAYQIRCFVGKSKMDDSQFAEVVSIPYEQISCFLAHQEPSLSVSQISKICDAFYISMDSLVRGPVEERAFQDLIKRCAFAGKLNGTIFYNIYMFFLKRWREKTFRVPVWNVIRNGSSISAQNRTCWHLVQGTLSMALFLPSASPERFPRKKPKN